MRTKSTFIMILVFVAIFCLTGEASAAFRIYDDFSGTFINGQKWTNLEFVREIQSGGLVSKIGSDSFDAGNRTLSADLAQCTSVGSDIKVVEINMDTGNNTRANAYIFATFYNADSAGPTGATGDVGALIGIGNRGNGLEALWQIVKFTDDQYSTYESIALGTLVEPGNLVYSAFYTVNISYDGGTQFTFTLNGYPQAIENGPERKADAYSAIKQLSTRIQSDIEASNRFIFAVFDDAYINGTLYDSFDGPKIDPSKWLNREFVREIANSKLQMDVQGYNSTTDNWQFLTDNNTSCLSVKVKVESGSALSAGAQGEIGVGGYFYNDTYGPGTYNQCEGEVWVATRLNVDEAMQIQATAIAYRSNNTDCTSWTAVFSPYVFPIPINLDTEHTLYVEMKDGDLIFKCDNETYVHNVTTSLNPTRDSMRSFRTRVNLGAGESGYLKATYDDVYICRDDIAFVSQNDSTCGGNSPCYQSIQEAITNASTGDEILIAGGTYSEAVTLNAAKSLTLQGGWDASFENQTGTTILRQAPKAPQGSLTLQELRITP